MCHHWPVGLLLPCKAWWIVSDCLLWAHLLWMAQVHEPHHQSSVLFNAIDTVRCIKCFIWSWIYIRGFFICCFRIARGLDQIFYNLDLASWVNWFKAEGAYDVIMPSASVFIDLKPNLNQFKCSRTMKFFLTQSQARLTIQEKIGL